MLKFSAKILVFVSILFASNQAAAGLVASLYDVDIPVVNESAGVRKKAFKQGLDEIFVRISGDSIVMDKLKRPPSSRYVKQFSYEPVTAQAEQSTINAITNERGETLTHRLKIQYNGHLMEKYLLDNGFPVWGGYRSDVVVWLVVRDGRNEYVLKGSDQSLLKTATAEAMTRRGIPVRWPLYDSKDKKALNAADIRGGFKEPVVNASQRYSTATALTGSLIWNGKQWQSGWSLFVEGESQHWSSDGADYQRLINKAIDRAADVLGVVFAVHNVANKQQVVSIQLDIQAVNSIEQYRYVENYLSGLSAVEKVKPFKVDGQNAVFKVLLRSNEEDFLNLIKNNAEFIEIEASQANTQIVSEVESSNAADKGNVIENDAEFVEIKVIQAKTQTISENETDSAIKVVEEAEAEETDVSLPLKQMPVYYYRFNQQ